MKEILKTTISGHVLIKDRATDEVLLDEYNAIHAANMATAIARGLANSPNYQVYKLKLGNQGTYIDASQQVIFRPTNTTSTTVDTAADLYNATYVEVVDEGDAGVGVGNSVTYTNVPASTSTRVIVTCVISSNEAINNAVDTGPGPTASESTFFFDELGLFTKETAGTQLNGTNELMLTHLIFSPIEHTGNRELTIVYTLTISVS